jgi:hypothetical protein
MAIGPAIELVVAPEAGFVAHLTSDVGVFHEYVAGTVSVRNDTLRLRPNRPTAALPRELVVIRWGMRRYLVESKEMLEYCNAVNAGKESVLHVGERFLCRREAKPLPAASLPQVPDEWKGRLLLQPVDVAIVKRLAERTEVVGGMPWSGVRIVNVLVDRGSAVGLRVGTRMYPEDRAGCTEPPLRAEVLEVRASESVLKIEVPMDWCPEDWPTPGLRFSTRLTVRGIGAAPIPRATEESDRPIAAPVAGKEPGAARVGVNQE